MGAMCVYAVSPLHAVLPQQRDLGQKSQISADLGVQNQQLLAAPLWQGKHHTSGGLHSVSDVFRMLRECGHRQATSGRCTVSLHMVHIEHLTESMAARM